MLILFFSIILGAAAIPNSTPTPTDPPGPDANATITAPASTITPDPGLTCSNGSTVIHTTDCTMGTPISYCHSPEPPIQCKTGSFPAVWHPGHCMELQTCYPLDANWITTDCSNGAVPWSTSTLYDGVLADGVSTTISGIVPLGPYPPIMHGMDASGWYDFIANSVCSHTVVSCSCAQNQWYSFGPEYNVFCMPTASCPPGMTTSVSTNSYCATAPASACSDIDVTANYCECADHAATPVYPNRVGAVATGCG